MVPSSSTNRGMALSLSSQGRLTRASATDQAAGAGWGDDAGIRPWSHPWRPVTAP